MMDDMLLLVGSFFMAALYVATYQVIRISVPMYKDWLFKPSWLYIPILLWYDLILTAVWAQILGAQYG